MYYGNFKPEIQYHMIPGICQLFKINKMHLVGLKIFCQFNKFKITGFRHLVLSCLLSFHLFTSSCGKWKPPAIEGVVRWSRR